MKCMALFLTLTMVVLMAQPGECFFGMLIKGIGSAIHGAKPQRGPIPDWPDRNAEAPQGHRSLRWTRLRAPRFGGPSPTSGDLTGPGGPAATRNVTSTEVQLCT
uniref:Uncharacterized protein n=1 Tax=Cyprinodon variegatus TaxID=28743 RepID=A0A3Q2DHP9_CYPVA